MKKFEKSLKEKIQSIEKEIPEMLETNFLSALEKINPDVPVKKPSFISKHRIAAIAALLLIIILYTLFPLFFKKNQLPPSRDILIQSASLEGKPAETYIFRGKNPDLTIIWIGEKSQGAI